MGDYDNIYLIPKGISSLKSRNDVDMRSDFHGLYPIISSPMAGISGKDLVIAMGQNNCLGLLHRFSSLLDRMESIVKISKSNIPYGVAIGINNWDEEFEIAKTAVTYGACMICVDIANGYIPQIEEVGMWLRSQFGNSVSLMCGNIITLDGAEYAIKSGFDFVRVGIGGGSVCSTRTITGVGRNQLCAIKDCSPANINIVSDGGIKSSGDIAKSFYAGADFVMLGSILAMALEAENNGELIGMASAKNHINNGKEIKSIEGIETTIDNSKKMPLKQIINQLLWGVKSSCTYLDCRSYKDIQYNAIAKPVDEKL